jgi:hypothetical protein
VRVRVRVRIRIRGLGDQNYEVGFETIGTVTQNCADFDYSGYFSGRVTCMGGTSSMQELRFQVSAWLCSNYNTFSVLKMGCELNPGLHSRSFGYRTWSTEGVAEPRTKNQVKKQGDMDNHQVYLLVKIHRHLTMQA